MDPGTAAPSPTANPSDEMLGVVRARQLVRSQPQAALTLLRSLERSHPEGYFLEERRALMVFALAAQGEPKQAQERAASFLRAYPHSAFADRVRSATANR
ncbi:MAG: hypothetical protein QM778_04720 [Myxococcales bacterium]